MATGVIHMSVHLNKSVDNNLCITRIHPTTAIMENQKQMEQCKLKKKNCHSRNSEAYILRSMRTKCVIMLISVFMTEIIVYEFFQGRPTLLLYSYT